MPYRTHPNQEQDLDRLSCVLCDRGRREVEKLIQGNSGCVCSDCIHQALTVIEPEPEPLANLRAAVSREVGALTGDVPYAVSGAIVRAALALWHDDPMVCREMSRHALRARNDELALEARVRIPEVQWTAADRIAIAFSCWETGQFRRGLEALAGGQWEDREDRFLRALNRGALLLELEADDIARGGEEIARARELFTGMLPASDPRAAYYASTLEGNVARHHHRVGRPAAAKESLARASKASPSVKPWWQLLLGDAHEALGEAKKAREAWDTALRAAHPESRAAREARVRLQR